MMEMSECKVFSGHLSACELLPGREKVGKLEFSKNIKSSWVVKDVPILLLREPNREFTKPRRQRQLQRYVAFVSEL